MAAPPPPPPRGTMSLYAELLGGPAAEPVAAAPASDAAVKPSAAKIPALRFQPIIRRPQQKPKATGYRLKSLPVPLSAVPATTTKTTSVTHTARPTLADWAAGADDDEYDNDHYDDTNDNGGPRPLRGGRKRKKKRPDEKQQQPHRRLGYGDIDWDELYDPARPTNLEAYLHSDECVSAVRDWKAVLYAHRRRLRRQNDDDDDDDDDDNNSDSSDSHDNHQFNSAFAPPAAFAPPPSLTTGSGYPAPTADEAAAAHPTLSHPQPPTSLPPPQSLPPPPPPPPSDSAVLETTATPATAVPTLADGLIISRAPVRFNTTTTTTNGIKGPDNDDDDDTYEPPPASADDDEGGPSSFSSARPGQAGFAARLMAKYGWTKGSGLGADGSGILNPLRHKNVGGATSGRGRIVGGGRGGRVEARGGESTELQNHVTSSSPSAVVVLRNMVEGMPDLAAEIADGQLVQEIGEECGEQYGRIERVYIDVPSKLVFIQFTDAVSALRAVTALDGRIFNGNAIAPSFYNADKFDQGIYE